MEISNISDEDAKYFLQLKNILKLTVTELKFSVADGKTVDKTIHWFDSLMEALGNQQKTERLAKKKIGTDGGQGSLKIKDYHPGDLSKSTKPKSMKKSKTRKSNKAKRKK